MKWTALGRSACVAVAMSVLMGCADRTWMTVRVRDRDTLEPVRDAMVSVQNTGINPLKPQGDEGETDAEGSVRVMIAAYNRLIIRVRADGRSEHVINADHPAMTGDLGWFGPKVAQGGTRATLEIRLTP